MAVNDAQVVLLTVDDVAGSLKIHRNSVYKLAASGSLTPICPGGMKTVRFDADEVRALVDSSRGVGWRKQETS